MKIFISGKPGTGHNRIASLLAKRLGLNFISGKYVTYDRAKQSNVSLDEHYRNYNRDLASEVDRILNTFVDNNKDLLCCSYLFNNTNTESAITIFIDSDLTSELYMPFSVHSRRQATRGYFDNMYSMDVYNKDLFDIVINRTLCEDDYIVQFIIELMYKGKIGYYIPSHICLPMQVSDKTKFSLTMLNKEFSIKKFFSLYLIDNDNIDLFELPDKTKMLKVKDSCVTDIKEFEVKPLIDYSNWFDIVGSNDVLKLSALLAKYCYNLSLHDVESIFMDLVTNGNPIRRLVEAGYDT